MPDDIDYIALHQGEGAIDFPCSYIWRAYYEETLYGRYLPPIEPSPYQGEVKPVIITRGLTPKERDELNQLKAHALFLERKLNEHLDKKKKKGRYLD